MTKKFRCFLLFTLCVTMLISCAKPAVSAKIERHPSKADFSNVNPYPSLPVKFDPNSENSFQNDFRSTDLSKLDLSKSLEYLLYSDFDSQTVWPTGVRMAAGFNPNKILELNKNPGLGLRKLHRRGINGKGVGIAIIDQPLLVDHQEYVDQVRLYEEIHVTPGTEATMHGAATASIAVGKSVGVAPKADLYYIGSWTGDFGVGENGFTYNFAYYAQAIRRVIEINKTLPPEHKIRVIAMQIGWSPSEKGYDDINAAVDEAAAAGIFSISSSLEETSGFKFNGLGRTPLSNPDQFSSFGPGLFWADSTYNRIFTADRLLVPMDSRTTASPTGIKDYVFYREGGWSWTTPYLAGMFALACQVKPDITPEEFWSTALKTGTVTQMDRYGTQVSYGTILNPQALIDALQE